MRKCFVFLLLYLNKHIIIMSEIEAGQNPPKKEAKKKPEAKTKVDVTEGRARAKTTIFEGKKPLEKPQPNKIVATGFGENKFSNLLSMFDKNKRSSCGDIQDSSNGKVVPSVGTLNPQRFGSFSNTQSSMKEQKPVEKQPVISSSLSIKERLELLKKEGEKTASKGTKAVDPVLEMHGDAEDDDHNEDENLDLGENESEPNKDIDDNLGLGDVGLGDDEEDINKIDD